MPSNICSFLGFNNNKTPISGINNSPNRPSTILNQQGPITHHSNDTTHEITLFTVPSNRDIVSSRKRSAPLKITPQEITPPKKIKYDPQFESNLSKKLNRFFAKKHKQKLIHMAGRVAPDKAGLKKEPKNLLEYYKNTIPEHAPEIIRHAFVTSYNKDNEKFIPPKEDEEKYFQIFYDLFTLDPHNSILHNEEVSIALNKGKIKLDKIKEWALNYEEPKLPEQACRLIRNNWETRGGTFKEMQKRYGEKIRLCLSNFIMKLYNNHSEFTAEKLEKLYTSLVSDNPDVKRIIADGDKLLNRLPKNENISTFDVDKLIDLLSNKSEGSLDELLEPEEGWMAWITRKLYG